MHQDTTRKEVNTVFKALEEMFAELIERYSKYNLNVDRVINDVINSMTGR